MKPARRSRGRPGWADLAEAAAALTLAALCLRLVPFSRLAERLNVRRPVTAANPAAQIDRVRRAIDAWTVRLPWPPKCFVRGLAALWMLQRRGIAAELSYGAATIAGALKAHVWVTAGGEDVVGGDVASDFALLAVFPSCGAGDSPRKW